MTLTASGGDPTTAERFGRRVLIFRSPSGRLSGRMDARLLLITVAALAAAVLLGLVSLGIGDYAVTLGAVVDVLGGGGSAIDRMVVLEWRMPRTALALAIGAALGVSGAIFQSLTRNPLGSPDIIGFNTGAYTGALIAIVVLDLGYLGIAAGALVGGFVTAVAVFLLASKRGLAPYRLIIVGIAIGAFLSGINTWLILISDLSTSMTAATWGAGTLNGIEWEQAGPALGVLLLLVPFVLLGGRPLDALALGDEAAQALGATPRAARTLLIAVAVALVAVATAAAGPIAFVALVSPQIARALTRSTGAGLGSSAAIGALLLVASDLAAQRLLAPIQLPVGVVTVSLGGAYLVFLLIRTARRTTRSAHA